MGTKQLETMKSRIKKNTKKYVLSFRVDETEWIILQKTSRKTGVDISTLLRQSLKAVLGPTPQG